MAKEYGIMNIRTQYEKPYAVSGSKKNFTAAFYVNRIKIFLLNTFTVKNKKVLESFHKTNDFLVGVGYTSMMDSQTIEYGLRKLSKNKENVVVEALFHPDAEHQNGEYQIPFDRQLLEKIKSMGFAITNYGGLSF